MKHPQLAVIADLVKPFQNKHETGANVTVEDVLSNNLELVIRRHSINIETLKYPCVNDDSSWKFVCVCLSMLEQLKDNISSAEKIEDELISLTERKEILSCMEFVITLGLLPYLLRGVGIPPEAQTRATNHLRPPQSLTPFQKYERLCLTVRSLLSLKDEFIFQSVLIPRFFNDLLAALFQLCFVPLKKPAENAASTSSEDSMTPAMWDRLQADREEFHQKLTSIIANSNQPFLIREIMVIQGNQSCPKWLILSCSKILSERLTQEGGLRATVSALCDTDFESPITWKKLDVITRIILSPNMNVAGEYYEKIIPQLLKAIRFPGNEGNKLDAAMKQVAIRCVKLIAETADVPESNQALQLLMRPFLRPSTSISETKITCCISDLLTCCTFSSNEMFRLPPKLLIPIINILFSALVKLSDTPLMLKNTVKELIYCIFWDRRNDASLHEILFACIFDDVKYCDKKVLDLNRLKFALGKDDGICFKDGKEQINIHEACNVILKLLTEKDTERLILKNLFVKFIKIVTEGDPIVSDLERNSVAIRILLTLSNDEKIQSVINQDPKLVVDFIISLLNGGLDANEESICHSLVILEVILSNVAPSSLCSDESYFKTLVKPLSKTLETTKDEEVRSLVKRILSLIEKQVGTTARTDESVLEVSSNMVPKSGMNTKPVSFQEAMHDVCDALLPVRAHGMMQLTKLIRSKNPEALTKKDVLFCLFKENLKHEDSYLYLSAAEGLATLAAELPDTVLMLLIEEYTTNENPELRLKVGETLLKSTRMLGDLVPKYKTDLLNAFLSGTRDLDPLVQASSLSNLGEVCKILGFKIGPIVVEILERVSDIIASDKDPEPRRAAMLVITLLLKGLQKDVFQVLEKQLLSLYRALKQIYLHEKDDVMKLHTQLAIEELNEITKEFLLTQQLLSKKVQVLKIT